MGLSIVNRPCGDLVVTLLEPQDRILFQLGRVHVLVDAFQGDVGLDHHGDDHGEHGRGEPEDVEEGDGYEGLLRVQVVGGVREDVGGERHQRHKVGGCLSFEVLVTNMV